jgi:PAS domain S-box-containing protein
MALQALPAPATQLFRYLFEQASLGIAVEDLEGNILLANPALCSLLGYTEKELCGMSCSEFANPEDSKDDWTLFQQLRAGLIDQYSLEKRYVRRNGTQLWGRLNVSLLKGDDGGVPLVFAFVENITERKLAEQELSRTNERFRLAVEAGKSVGWEWDLKTGRDSWFGDLQSMFGISSDTFVGRPEDFYRHVHPDDRQLVAKAVADARQDRKPYAAEFRVVRLDGSVRWVTARGKFFYAANGDPERMLGMAVDITEKRLAEESSRLFRKLIDESNDAIEVVDPETLSFLDVNERACRELGYTREELLTRRVTDIDLTLDKSSVMPRQKEINESGSVLFETVRQRKDGSTYPVEINLKRVELDRVYLINVVRDITDRRRIEETLRESEQRLLLAMQAGGMYAFDWNTLTDVIVRSGNRTNIFEWTNDPNLATEAAFCARIHPADRGRYSAAENGLSPGNPVYEVSFRVLHPDGSVIWLNDNGRGFFNAQGKLLRVVGMVADITERKRAEEALRQSEAELTEAQRLAGLGSWQWDARTDTVIWSKELYRLTGIDPHLPAPSYKEHSALYAPDSWKRLQRDVQNALQNGTSYELDLETVQPEAVAKWVIARGEPQREPGGQIIGLCGTVQDITRRKRAEEALRESELRERRKAEELEAILDAVPVPVLVAHDADCRRITGNRVACEQLRVAAGGNFSLSAGPGERPEFRNIENGVEIPSDLLPIQQAASTGRPVYERPMTMVFEDGTKREEIVNAVPLLDEEGRVRGAVAASVDVTLQNQAEEALKKSEEKFSKAFRQSPMPLTITSAIDHRYIDVNETFERESGWRRDELITRTPFDVGLWVNPAEREDFAKRILTVGYVRPLEAQFRRKSGEIRIFSITSERIELNGEPCMITVGSDITDRKHAEEALRESEDKLRLLLDSTAEAIYGIDLEHRCTFCNPACLRTLGYESTDAVLGQNMHDLLHHTRADGTLFPLEECRVHNVLGSGEGIHADDEVLWRANGTSFPAEYWSYPQRRGEKVVGAVIAFIDITQRKLAESALANVSRKLIEAQEQERTRIARELHDDIGQRLGMLAIELEQLRQTSSDLPVEVRNGVGRLWKQTSDIAADVQSLSHELHSSKLQYLGIAAAIRGFCKEFGEQQRVEIDFTSHDLLTPLSPEISLCLFRVLQESLHNSVKHSGARQFEVRLWGTSHEVRLTVRDSGVGFDREMAKKSQGLGLVSMEERLKVVGGTLSIESQLYGGTVVHARVPLDPRDEPVRATG